MPDCPFSPDRLRELRFAQGWRIDQIATLASAHLDEPIDLATVTAWFAAAGLRTDPATPDEAAALKRDIGLAARPQPGRRHQSQPGTIETRPCSQCGKPVTRTRTDFKGESVLCSPECQSAWTIAWKAERRETVRLRAIPTIDKKTCYVCKEAKLLSEFGADRSRMDGLKNICLTCEKQKQADYYQRRKEI